MIYNYYEVLLTGLFFVILFLLVMVFRWRIAARSNDPLRVVSVKRMEDILLPDRMGGEIHLQHILLTAKGLVVVDVKTVSGTVFGGDLLDEWTVIRGLSRSQRRQSAEPPAGIVGAQRFTFPNPQYALNDRVAALKSIVRDIPVKGHVLFLGDVEFGKDRPTNVILSDELEDLYRKPHITELGRLMEAFQPHWEKVEEARERAPKVVAQF